MGRLGRTNLARHSGDAIRTNAAPSRKIRWHAPVGLASGSPAHVDLPRTSSGIVPHREMRTLRNRNSTRRILDSGLGVHLTGLGARFSRDPEPKKNLDKERLDEVLFGGARPLRFESGRRQRRHTADRLYCATHDTRRLTTRGSSQDVRDDVARMWLDMPSVVVVRGSARVVLVSQAACGQLITTDRDHLHPRFTPVGHNPDLGGPEL